MSIVEKCVDIFNQNWTHPQSQFDMDTTPILEKGIIFVPKQHETVSKLADLKLFLKKNTFQYRFFGLLWHCQNMVPQDFSFFDLFLRNPQAKLIQLS